MARLRLLERRAARSAVRTTRVFDAAEERLRGIAGGDDPARWTAALARLAAEAVALTGPGPVIRVRSADMPALRVVAMELGATVEERGFDTTVTAGGVHELLREAYRALPEIAELEFVEASAGLRPATPDGGPLLGEWGEEGLLVASGHYRSGILRTPVTAATVAAVRGYFASYGLAVGALSTSRTLMRVSGSTSE